VCENGVTHSSKNPQTSMSHEHYTKAMMSRHRGREECARERLTMESRTEEKSTNPMSRAFDNGITN